MYLQPQPVYSPSFNSNDLRLKHSAGIQLRPEFLHPAPLTRTRNVNKDHPDIWEYAGTTDAEENQSIRTTFESLYHMLESHVFLVMLCQQLLSTEGTVGTAYSTPRM